MIKKLILALVAAVSVYGTYLLITSGLQMNRLPIDYEVNVLSFKEMESRGSTLNSKLTQIDSLNTSQIVAARNKVETESANYEAQKAKYEELEASASEEEIAEANKEQEYLLDYLWIVIGNYANDNNVKFKMETDNVNLRINFDITGSYVSIINFIYDLENDENLKFNLNGIQLASGVQEDPAKASFSVDGVTVKTSNVSVN